jgi:xanthine dehydrogenase accessory factor
MKLHERLIVIRGAGEMASGVAWRLFHSHFKVLLTEIPKPLAVRRMVSFCEAVYEGRQTVEGVEALLIPAVDQAEDAWRNGRLPLLIDPDLSQAGTLNPDVLVDAILAKENLGTRLTDAPWVVALGPGFRAGIDAHLVVETNRGHHLGRLYTEGEAEANTGTPGNIGGFTGERVLRAPVSGLLRSEKNLGARVEAGESVAEVGGHPVRAQIGGMLRGLLRTDTLVPAGLKVGDVDPRGDAAYCATISEKARAIAGAVLEGILWRYNR